MADGGLAGPRSQKDLGSSITSPMTSFTVSITLESGSMESEVEMEQLSSEMDPFTPGIIKTALKMDEGKSGRERKPHYHLHSQTKPKY